jgi:hypothetical protein
VSDRPEVRKVLEAEIRRSLAGVLRSTYADIVADLRKAGVQPGLSVRTTEGPGGGEHSRAAPFAADPARAPRQPTAHAAGLGGRARGPTGPAPGRWVRAAACRPGRRLRRDDGGAHGWPRHADRPRRAGDDGLLRRLAQAEPAGFDRSGAGSAASWPRRATARRWRPT